MGDKLKVSVVLPATPEEVFAAWLSGPTHSRMTGAQATIKKDGSFTAWDGYCWGKTLKTVAGKSIKQTWRTDEFGKETPDSKLEVQLSKARGGTKLVLTHSSLPKGTVKGFREGWVEFYFEPMKAYFKAKNAK